MTTITKSQTHQGSNTHSVTEHYNKLVEKLEFSYFGLISMTILIGSIIGGIAAMFVFENNAPMWQFLLCLGFSMINNVFAIAQAPTKWVLNTFILTVLINIFIIIINNTICYL